MTTPPATEARSARSMLDVIALGDVNVDIMAEFSAFPAQGGDALAQSTEFHCGGSAANTAMALARVGLRASLIARIGPDPWASKALYSLNEAGVRLDCLQRDPSVMTGLMYIVVTPDGERTILGFRGANVLVDPAHIREECFLKARLLHLSGYALLDEPQRSAAMLALELARQHRLTVTLDPGMTISDIVMDEVRALLPHIDVLLPTLAEARHLTGLAEPEGCARALLEWGVPLVAMKLGDAGCLIGDSGGLFQVPAFSVEVWDSTGAGDSFDAGVIAGLLGGLDRRSTAVLANAMGAVTAACVGCSTSGSLVQELLALLRDPHQEPVRTESAGVITRATKFVNRLRNLRGKE